MQTISPISPMFQAFLSQTKIDDKAADKREEQEQLAHQANYNKAVLLLSRSQNCSDYMEIPSKLKKDELNQKTITHEKLKNYDHSLDKVRIKFEIEDGLETGSVEEVMGSMFNG